MSEVLAELLKKINASTLSLILVLFTIFLILILRAVIKNRKGLLDWFTAYLARKKELNDVINLTYKLKKQCDQNSQEIQKYYDYRLHDREQSFEKQRDLTSQISALDAKLDQMQKVTNRRVQADLKERIRQSYQVYKSEKSWNTMEKEGFMGLVTEYELAGGTNSFVHDIILPDVETWEVIDIK